MIQEYSKYYEETTGAFDDYRYCLKLDPVKRFLNMCIEENLDQDYESIINYLSRLFYSVKGTTKVFDYMKNYLGLEFEGEIIYTTRYIEFTLKNLKVNDESLFYEYLEDFLSALLYFEEFRTTAKTIRLEIANKIENELSSGIVCYKSQEIEEYK